MPLGREKRLVGGSVQGRGGRVRVVAKGGDALLCARYSSRMDTVDQGVTLDGLRIIDERNCRGK